MSKTITGMTNEEIQAIRARHAETDLFPDDIDDLVREIERLQGDLSALDRLRLDLDQARKVSDSTGDRLRTVTAERHLLRAALERQLAWMASTGRHSMACLISKDVDGECICGLKELLSPQEPGQ